MKTFKEAFGSSSKVSPLQQSTRMGLMGIKELTSLVEALIDSGQLDKKSIDQSKKTISDVKEYKKILDKIEKTGKY